MNRAKRAKLAKHGWAVGSVREFLGLSEVEAALVELRLALSQDLKTLREKRHLSQIQLAQRLKSSQSRVAKMEAGDRSVSVDLLFRSLFAIGARPRDLARTIGQIEHRIAV